MMSTRDREAVTREILPVNQLTGPAWASQDHEIREGSAVTVVDRGAETAATVRWVSASRLRVVVVAGDREQTFHLRGDGTYGDGRSVLLLGSAKSD